MFPDTIITCTNGLVFLRYNIHVYMYFINFVTCCIDNIVLTPVFHVFPLSNAGNGGSTRKEKTCHCNVSRKLCSFVCVRSTLAVISSCALQTKAATRQEKVCVKMLCPPYLTYIPNPQKISRADELFRRQQQLSRW